MARLFRRRQRSPAQQFADALGRVSDSPARQVVAATNNVNIAPTQYRLLDSMITQPSGFVAALESVSQCSQIVPPAALNRALPLEVPVTGHNLILSLINHSETAVVITDLLAVCTWIVECEFPAQLRSSSGSIPSLVLSEDLRPASEQAESGYRPLENPHYEVHLDSVRPLIVEALLPDGSRPRERVSIPFSLAPGANERIVLAPVTSLPLCIGWRLLARWQEDDAYLYSAWDLTVTGFTGWLLHTAEAEPIPSPVANLGHWDPYTVYEDGHTAYDDHLAMTSRPNPAWLKESRRTGKIPFPESP